MVRISVGIFSQNLNVLNSMGWCGKVSMRLGNARLGVVCLGQVWRVR